ncbi:2-oxoglutarate and iron-dependent oxygenase domain-containing protein 3 isoform X1 [Cavia porcellus]|uniref:2-oxoglutarate and iron-dependent oxygenase domain-containing protein 3 isoform X1 n=1 Tax=Cavia porcellus TaxID=10141 RepID=UPI000350DE73|nr:2-oxoglutarate and iron-dependent oxygenase domain-containing protein 3 isoform X1 [Cavia porcellus]
MAPQRRGPLRTAEGSGATERRRPSSTKKARELRDTRRAWLKTLGLGASITLALILIWISLGADDGVAEVLARRGEVLEGKFIEVPCSEDYDGHRRFEGCTPRKCGRGVTDVVISREEAEHIRRVAEKGLSLGGSDGGASILDLHSGALSVGKHFVNLYRYFGDKIHTVFSEEDFQLYRDVRRKVQLAIAEAFGISSSLLYLTKPTFFSRINSTEAQTAHDEYWHAHVDKVGFPSSLRGPRTCTGWKRSAGAPAMPSPLPSPVTPTMALRTRLSRSPGAKFLPAPGPPPTGKQPRRGLDSAACACPIFLAPVSIEECLILLCWCFNLLSLSKSREPLSTSLACALVLGAAHDGHRPLHPQGSHPGPVKRLLTEQRARKSTLAHQRQAQWADGMGTVRTQE